MTGIAGLGDPVLQIRGIGGEGQGDRAGQGDCGLRRLHRQAQIDHNDGDPGAGFQAAGRAGIDFPGNPSIRPRRGHFTNRRNFFNQAGIGIGGQIAGIRVRAIICQGRFICIRGGVGHCRICGLFHLFGYCRFAVCLDRGIGSIFAWCINGFSGSRRAAILSGLASFINELELRNLRTGDIGFHLRLNRGAFDQQIGSNSDTSHQEKAIGGENGQNMRLALKKRWAQMFRDIFVRVWRGTCRAFSAAPQLARKHRFHGCAKAFDLAHQTGKIELWHCKLHSAFGRF